MSVVLLKVFATAGADLAMQQKLLIGPCDKCGSEMFGRVVSSLLAGEPPRRYAKCSNLECRNYIFDVDAYNA